MKWHAISLRRSVGIVVGAEAIKPFSKAQSLAAILHWFTTFPVDRREAMVREYLAQAAKPPAAADPADHRPGREGRRRLPLALPPRRLVALTEHPTGGAAAGCPEGFCRCCEAAARFPNCGKRSKGRGSRAAEGLALPGSANKR